MALTEGINLYKHLGLKQFTVEGDSQIIINAIRMGKILNQKVNSMLEKFIQSIKYFIELANLGANDINTIECHKKIVY